MTDHVKRFDGPTYSVEHREHGGWFWVVSEHFHDVSGLLWEPYWGQGATFSRWGAIREAKRCIRRRRHHERLKQKNTVTTVLPSEAKRRSIIP